MKSTGIVRRVDELGRVVVPMELRRTLGIESGDPMEVYVEGDRVILKKYSPGCTFCGSMDNLRQVSGEKLICSDCVDRIRTS